MKPACRTLARTAIPEIALVNLPEISVLTLATIPGSISGVRRRVMRWLSATPATQGLSGTLGTGMPTRIPNSGIHSADSELRTESGCWTDGDFPTAID